MKTSRLLYWTVFIFAFFGVISFLLWKEYCLEYAKNLFLKNQVKIEKEKNQVSQRKPLAHLLIDYGNGKKRVFEGEVVDGLDLKTLLEFLTEDKKISSKFKKGEKGFILESLDGLKNNSKNWKCFLNGKVVEKDFEKILIKEGDKIELVYQ